MKLLTFNIRHAKALDERIDLNRILAVLRQSHADVIALQEVDRNMPRSGYVDQAAQLADELQMDWRFAASLRHGRSEYGNAILSRLPIIDDEVAYLPGDRERRSLLKMKLLTTAGEFLVLTTHLGVTERDRARQIPLLIAQLTRLDLHAPAALMGDFNMESAHLLLRGITELGWREAELAHDSGGTVTGGATIDHIFLRNVNKGYKAYTTATVASDHAPVMVKLDESMV